MSDDVAFAPPILYTGPTPSPPNLTPSPVTTPTITSLSPRIISSTNKIFFIAHKLGTSSVREWRLVRVAFSSTMLLYPSALQDGRFLVEFYVAHPSDVRFNAINQCFWLQYRAMRRRPLALLMPTLSHLWTRPRTEPHTRFLLQFDAG